MGLDLGNVGCWIDPAVGSSLEYDLGHWMDTASDYQHPGWVILVETSF